ncbi:TCR/Tet family MFS transporter [Caulobacter sp. RL271]|jgi:DHA1 family tetracycline resistance protein-like MFS transporter|uniref:TCR/Tet family MFS transporter n=1 Tax=Caulobacter segnis TaxID=88688 RepID=A0ABY5A169_9CAUL|nr:TCR/Tet family MFS transporter [Caulobacter segnis]USQ97881.1 TCR/Tet family MFS transporter [Caulobacter segnis]
MNQPISGNRRQAALGFIFVTATMDVLSLGVMIPVLPNLVKMLGGGDTAAAADWVVLFATTWGVMQFFCSPILGLMSDRFGRRPVILTSIFGLGVDFLFMAFAPNLWWLFVGRIFNGMTAASFSTASAYVADVTTPENRAKGFGLMGAAFGVGFTFGPALGGWLWQFDHRAPFLVCAALALCNWLYGFFVLPESLPPERRQPRFDWKKANPVGSLHLLQRHPGLLGLAGVGFLFQLAHNVLPSVFVLYMGFRYGWSPATIGLTLMASGVSGIIVQALVVGRVVKAVGERGALLIGLFSGFAGFMIYALAPTGFLYLCGLPLFALSGLIQPGLQGLMTRRVLPNEQGQLQGANSAMMGIASIVGPPLFLLPFAFAVRHDAALHLPGLPVLIAAALMLAATALAYAKARPAPAPEPQAA